MSAARTHVAACRCLTAAMAVPWPDAVDLGDNAYWLVVGSVMTALALGALGLVVGLGTLVRRRRTPRPA